MLAISRALMAHPRLLLLDEPSQGLAPSIVDVVFDVITRLNAATGLTILLVEQNARQALTLAHHAYVLQGGTIALAGVPDELARNQAVQELYLGGYTPSAHTNTGGSSPMSTPTLAGITARTVATPRLATHVLTHGAETGTPVVLIHGNVSAARFFEETMLALPASSYAVAPDLRGFGRTETKPVA
jgi:ABC-type sulfate/molybdate transport systems ATPase subunit